MSDSAVPASNMPDVPANLSLQGMQVDAVLRENGPYIGHANVKEFVVQMEACFLAMVRQLQTFRQCLGFVSIMTLDLNLGGNHSVQNMVTHDPLRQAPVSSTPPPAGLAPPRAYSANPVHHFLQRAKMSFSNLIRILESQNALAASPSVMMITLTLDQRNQTCVASITPNLTSSNSEDDATDPGDGESRGVPAVIAPSDSPGISEQPRLVRLGDQNPGTTNEQTTDSNPASTPTAGTNTHVSVTMPVAMNPPPVSTNGTTSVTDGPNPTGRRAGRQMRDGATARPARDSRHETSGSQAIDAINWGPVRGIGYFARFRSAPTGHRQGSSS